MDLFCPHFMVEATGLEPTTSWSLTKRATKLRYASMCYTVLANSITYYNHTKYFSQAFFYGFFNFFLKNKNFLASFYSAPIVNSLFPYRPFKQLYKFCDTRARRIHHKHRHHYDGKGNPRPRDSRRYAIYKLLLGKHEA